MIPKLTSNMPSEHGMQLLMAQFPQMFQPEQTPMVDEFGMAQEMPPYYPQGSVTEYMDAQLNAATKVSFQNATKGAAYGIATYGLGNLIRPGSHLSLTSRVLTTPAKMADSLGSYMMSGKIGQTITQKAGLPEWRTKKGVAKFLGMFIPSASPLRAASSYLMWNVFTGNPDRMDLSYGSVISGIGTHWAIGTALDMGRRYAAPRIAAGLVGFMDEQAAATIKRDFGGITGQKLTGKALADQKIFGGGFQRRIYGGFADYTSSFFERMSGVGETFRIRGMQYEMQKLALRPEMPYVGAVVTRSDKGVWGIARKQKVISSTTRKAIEDLIQRGNKYTEMPLASLETSAEYKAWIGEFEQLKAASRNAKVGSFTIKNVGSRMWRTVKAPFTTMPESISKFVTPVPEAVGIAGSEKLLGTIGRYAVHGARIASAVASGAAFLEVANAIQSYRTNISREFIREAQSYETAFSQIPDVPMASNERQRAIEAIQGSNLNLRNYLGQEATLIH